ncbi:MAG: hypothetical protein ACE5H9_05520 [Anaerolineae bacterium]
MSPERIEFIFPAGQTLDAVGARLVANGWWGEIVGPHGSGKSTLLQALLRWAEAAGAGYQFYFLNQAQRSLPSRWQSGSPPVFYAVDGAEQLSGWSWWRLRRRCRQQGCGLLITAHHSLKLPPLYTTRAAEPEFLCRLVTALAGPDETPDPSFARELCRRHRGNIRLILFELYDHWEKRRRSS